MAKKQEKIYTITQVNSLIKSALEDVLPGRLTVSAEISGWKRHSSGHCYFTLKDDSSQIPCVMWSSNFAKIKFEPENGMSVLARGYIDIYPPQGKLQFYVEKLEPAGIGSLQLAFEKMVTKLHSEGLFDQEHKKPLPKYPARIGILTSDSGAAIGDISDSIYNRWPAVELFLFAVPVQGETAAKEIAKVLNLVNKTNKENKLDLLIVGRGGGSMEDLWPFNEEVLARAIFSSDIPVISAVGHEYDTTIADLVADARASTPTKAGVIAVPDKNEILADISQYSSRLINLMESKFQLAKQRLSTNLASNIFRNPVSLVDISRQKLDNIEALLVAKMSRNIDLKRTHLTEAYGKISLLEPTTQLKNKHILLNNLQKSLSFASKRVINEQKNRLNLLYSRLEKSVTDRVSSLSSVVDAKYNQLRVINPKAVIKRGYSISILENSGKLVKSAKDLNKGDIMVTEFSDNSKAKSVVK